jgi:hypothetical protein
VRLRRFQYGHALVYLQVAPIDKQSDLGATFGDNLVMRQIGHFALSELDKRNNVKSFRDKKTPKLSKLLEGPGVRPAGWRCHQQRCSPVVTHFTPVTPLVRN